MPSIDVCRLRLANQHLTTQRLEKASDVVRLFGAVQAQEYSPAKWGVAQRTRSATDAEVENEVSIGSILRTHVLRPTWHFVAPPDIRWMLELTAPRVRAAMASYDRKLELDAAILKRSRAVLTKSLRDGKQLTRAELAKELTKARIRADGTQRLAHLVMHAELDGLICSGARRGKQFTYALLDERVPPTKSMERDAALAELASRYFNTRGPATIDDFAWWSGLAKADARRAVEAIGETLEHATIGGRGYWFPHNAATARESPIARLLPIYDEYFIGLRDRTAMQTRLQKAKREPFSALTLRHVVTVDGQIVGGWNWISKGSTAAVELVNTVRLTQPERQSVTREVERFGAFLGAPAALTQA
jgi:hypothetical protein